MTTAEVTIKRTADHVATVEIHRAPSNFLDLALIAALGDAFEDVDRSGARAIVLCSEGKNFSAGADLTGASSAEPISADGAADFYRAAIRLFANATPVIACVQGAAVGAGAGLALAADLRVASPSTRFVFPFSRLGFQQGFGITATLPPLVGTARALDLLYTSRPCMGEEAMRIGLCDRLVPAEQIREQAHALAAEIAASAPLAVASIRRSLRDSLVSAVRTATDEEFREQLRLRATHDHREALRAAAAGEEPRFNAT
jgi:enoyl-CoA hydratase/carnithine racemase